MLALNMSLDRILNYRQLNAVLPSSPNKFKALNWTDTDGDSVGCNADLEERFHAVYGPYIREDYVEQINEILQEAVDRVENNQNWSGWRMCSTVRLKLRTGNYQIQPIHLKTITIECIFVRPCLQKTRILGKCLQFLALHTSENVRICVSQCYAAASGAMVKYYGGHDAEVFSSIVGYERRVDIPYTTYLSVGENEFKKSKEKLVEYAKGADVAYPSCETLNGIRMDQISELDLNWSTLALMNVKYDLGLRIINFHFVIGCQVLRLYNQDVRRNMIDNTIQALEHRVSSPSEEERRIMDWVKESRETILSDDDLFTVNRAVLDEYKSLVNTYRTNCFLGSLGCNFDDFKRFNLKEINRGGFLIRASRFLSEKIIRTGSMPDEQVNFVNFFELGLSSRKMLKEGIQGDDFAARLLLGVEFSLTYSYKLYDFEVKFEMPEKFEAQRVEFISVAAQMGEKLAILCADT